MILMATHRQIQVTKQLLYFIKTIIYIYFNIGTPSSDIALPDLKDYPGPTSIIDPAESVSIDDPQVKGIV